MISLERLPPLPNLKNIVTVGSRPGGTWSVVRDAAKRCNVSLILDMRSDSERQHPPDVHTLGNLATMHKFGFDRASGLLLPQLVENHIRRPISAKPRKKDQLPVVEDAIHDMYVDTVFNQRRALEKGRVMHQYLYGSHRGIVFIGSAEKWWRTERLYLQCLLKDAWPQLQFHHV
ncbi:MAG: hypothetical protein NUV56_01085 [Candidatus Uhrbacteria bacterium]|nr:hypothetical protein [Candidatus Uhrbacteria bacterium]